LSFREQFSHVLFLRVVRSILHVLRRRVSYFTMMSKFSHGGLKSWFFLFSLFSLFSTYFLSHRCIQKKIANKPLADFLIFDSTGEIKAPSLTFPSVNRRSFSPPSNYLRPGELIVFHSCISSGRLRANKRWSFALCFGTPFFPRGMSLRLLIWHVFEGRMVRVYSSAFPCVVIQFSFSDLPCDVKTFFFFASS